jgi:hypothetical protein
MGGAASFSNQETGIQNSEEKRQGSGLRKKDVSRRVRRECREKQRRFTTEAILRQESGSRIQDTGYRIQETGQG